MKFPLLHLRSLLWPVTASVAFHAGLLLLATRQTAQRPVPRIEVRLPLLPDMPAGDLLKNTFDNVAKHGEKAQPKLAFGRNPAHAQAQQRRLAEHVFYPPQAVQQGMQGEVRLLLRLDAKGRLLEARVASSSGHDLLDRAAVEAAYATQVFPGGGSELILPVVFRLSE